MNYRRAAITAATSIVALLFVSGATFAVLLVTFNLGSAFSFGGGSSIMEQALWLIVPPTAIGIGSALVTLALGAAYGRSLASAIVAFALSVFVSLKEIVPFNLLLDHEARFIAFMLLVILVLTLFIAVIRRSNVPSRIAKTVYAILAAFIIGESIVFATVIATTAFLILLVTWVVLPMIIGFLLPDEPDNVR